MKPILLALFEFSLSNGTRKELFGDSWFWIYLNTLGVIFDAFLSCSFRFEPLRRIRSYLWTRRQATNPISNLVELRNYSTAELISVAPHMSYCILNYCTPLYCLSVQHSHSRDNGRVSRLSQRNGGIITTVRLALAGLCLLLSSSPRWGADECRLMILGVGGICQKSYLLLIPPSNMVGIDPPDCDAWELTFHLVLSAEIADTTSG